jgi:hypothetical protein
MLSPMDITPTDNQFTPDAGSGGPDRIVGHLHAGTATGASYEEPVEGIDYVRNIRFLRAMWDEATDVADSLDRSTAWIVRRALARYLDETRRMKNDIAAIIDWGPNDESGSSGWGYAVTLHFHLPALNDPDQIAYDLKDRLIHELSAVGAREVWSEMVGIRALAMDTRVVPGDLAGY